MRSMGHSCLQSPRPRTTPSILPRRGRHRANRLTLAGTPGAAVAVANVAAGVVAAGSTDAVNGGQLYATDQVAQQAATIAANSVQYDPGPAGVSLAATGAPPVAVHGVAAGTAATDAVNVASFTPGCSAR